MVSPAPAQKLVDPASVAPEYREAAEKRRAELEKIMPRERTSFLVHCLESDDGK